jgi:hypothetical protein
MKYNVSIKASYYDDLEIEAGDVDEARHKAIATFQPCPDNLFSIDVFGLDPWTLAAEDEDPNAVDAYRDSMR